jgi:hypothetical protein
LSSKMTLSLFAIGAMLEARAPADDADGLMLSSHQWILRTRALSPGFLSGSLQWSISEINAKGDVAGRQFAKAIHLR